jgi:hypothetical protein
LSSNKRRVPLYLLTGKGALRGEDLLDEPKKGTS